MRRFTNCGSNSQFSGLQQCSIKHLVHTIRRELQSILHHGAVKNMAYTSFSSLVSIRVITYITLPPGKWSVSVSMLGLIYTAGNHWVQTGFSASSSSIALGADGVSGGPTIISGLVVGNANNMITGTVIINNTSGANKTYYYCTASTASQTLTNLGRDQYGENSIVAYPMN